MSAVSGIMGGAASLVASGEQKAASTMGTWADLKMKEAAMKLQEAQYNQMLELSKPYMENELTIEEQQIAMNEIAKKSAEMGIDFQKWKQDTMMEQSEWSFDTMMEQSEWSFDTLKQAVSYRDDMQKQYQKLIMEGPGDFDTSEYAKTARSNIDRTMEKVQDKLVSQGLASGPTGQIGKDLTELSASVTANEIANQRQNWLGEWAATKLAPTGTLLADSQATLSPGLATGGGYTGATSGGYTGATSGTYGGSGMAGNMLGQMGNVGSNLASTLMNAGATANAGYQRGGAYSAQGLLGAAGAAQQSGQQALQMIPLFL